MHLFVSRQLNLFDFIFQLLSFVRCSCISHFCCHCDTIIIEMRLCCLNLVVCQNIAIEIKRLFMSIAYCFSHHRILTVYFFFALLLFTWCFISFYFAMPILHIKLIDHNDRSDPCFYLWWFQFSLALFFLRQDLLWDFISFTLCDVSALNHFSNNNNNKKRVRACDNNVSWARQCHPLRIPHAYHKKSIKIILISIFVLRFLFTRISRPNNNAT